MTATRFRTARAGAATASSERRSESTARKRATTAAASIRPPPRAYPPRDGTRAHLEREIFAHGEVYGQGTVSGWDWRFGVLTLVAFVGVVMLTLGYGLMADKNTRYPFEPWEMARWNRLQHLTRAGITPLPLGTGSS